MKYIVPAVACLAILLFLAFAEDRDDSPEIPSAAATPEPAADPLLVQDLGRDDLRLALNAVEPSPAPAKEPAGPPSDGRGTDPSAYGSAEEILIEDDVVAKSAAVEGWAFELRIRRVDHPEIASWLDELDLLRDRRRQRFDALLGG